MIVGCGQAEQGQKDHLDWGEIEQVLTAYDVGYVLGMVIKCRGEEIGDDVVLLTLQNDVANRPDGCFGGDVVLARVTGACFTE